MSQINKVKEHLESGKSITQKDAIELFNAYRLSAIIFNLREEGMNIAMERVKGLHNTYGSYKMY